MTYLLMVLSLLGWVAQPADRSYEVGQVWEYRTRPQDEGSLVRIQRIEPYGDETVYHVSMIGLRMGGLSGGQVGHLPVSRATLDASVTRLSTSTATFPDPTEGIAEWRNDQGGIFTIPLAQIADVVEEMVRRAGS